MLLAPVAAGNRPALNTAVALVEIRPVGIVLFGKACPGVRPKPANLAISTGSLVFGTWMADGSNRRCPPWGATGTEVALISPPWTSLRHSMLKKKKVFFSWPILGTGPPALNPNVL